MHLKVLINNRIAISQKMPNSCLTRLWGNTSKVEASMFDGHKSSLYCQVKMKTYIEYIYFRNGLNIIEMENCLIDTNNGIVVHG